MGFQLAYWRTLPSPAVQGARQLLRPFWGAERVHASCTLVRWLFKGREEVLNLNLWIWQPQAERQRLAAIPGMMNPNEVVEEAMA